MLSPSPVVSEDDLGRLVAVQLEVVSCGPCLHFDELRMPRRLVAGRDDDIRVVGVLRIEFPGTAATRSPAVTTYAAGTMADPWIILALMSSSEESSSLNTVQWEWLARSPPASCKFDQEYEVESKATYFK